MVYIPLEATSLKKVKKKHVQHYSTHNPEV